MRVRTSQCTAGLRGEQATVHFFACHPERSSANDSVVSVVLQLWRKGRVASSFSAPDWSTAEDEDTSRAATKRVRQWLRSVAAEDGPRHSARARGTCEQLGARAAVPHNRLAGVFTKDRARASHAAAELHSCFLLRNRREASAAVAATSP